MFVQMNNKTITPPQKTNKNINFGATLKINTRYRKMESSVIDFLEREFEKKTENIKGRLDVAINGDNGYKFIKDTISYNNGRGYKNTIEIKFDTKAYKEVLLDKLVNSLNGFLIRENAQNKIDVLKNEIKEISNRAYNDSAKEFKKSFQVYEESLSTNEINKRMSPLLMMINGI